MPHTQVAGFPVWQMQMGNGASRALLIHCMLAHSGAWTQMMARLNDVLSATAFDLPGHGRSGPWDKRGDYQTVATAIATELAETGPVDIIGHSFGATVALRMAVERPDLVRSLTLIEPVYFAALRGTPAYAAYSAEAAPFKGAMMAGDTTAAARMFVSVWGAGQGWEALSDTEKAYFVDRIDLISASAGQTDRDSSGILAAGRLEGVTVPVLLIDGENSPPVIHAIQKVLAARLPNATNLTIEGAGHMVPITHAVPVAQAIAAHIAAI